MALQVRLGWEQWSSTMDQYWTLGGSPMKKEGGLKELSENTYLWPIFISEMILCRHVQPESEIQ